MERRDDRKRGEHHSDKGERKDLVRADGGRDARSRTEKNKGGKGGSAEAWRRMCDEIWRSGPRYLADSF